MIPNMVLERIDVTTYQRMAEFPHSLQKIRSTRQPLKRRGFLAAAIRCETAA
jgi:hypothetical protein